MARGAYFDPNIDPRLLKALETVGAGYKKNKVELFSGRAARPKNPSSYHPRGGAVDVNLYGDDGKVLNNFQDPSSAQAYQAYANEVYKWAQANDPSLAKDLRWGGYFGGGEWSRDWMHFDTGGAARTAGGNWQQGFDPAYMKEAGLASSGGLGEMAQSMIAEGYSMAQVRDAIAAIESKGSGDYNAVGVETDKGDHAYGRYQVMGNNVAPWAKQYLGRDDVTTDMFLKDPKLQDEMFDAVYGDYVKQYGLRGAASKWFTGSEKEPATTDALGRLTGKTYADSFMEQLGRMPKDASGAPVAETPIAGPGGDAKDVFPPAPKKEKTPWQKFGTGFMGALGTAEAPKVVASGVSDQPRASLVGNDPTTYTTIGGEAEERRAKLAQMMARLNSGKLF